MKRASGAPQRLLWLTALWTALAIAWMCGACINSLKEALWATL